MSGAVDPPRDVEPALDDRRARLEPRRADRARAVRTEPTTLVPAGAGVVLHAEAAAIVRLVLLVPLLTARPTGS
jgi:hypothetical protein